LDQAFRNARGGRRRAGGGEVLTVMMKEIDVSRAYGYFERGSTVLLVTHDGKRPNVMTISYHMMLDESGTVAVGMGPWDYSFETLKRTKECVIAIPAANLLETAVKIGNCSGSDTDKFKVFGLTALPSKTVKPPLLGDAYVNCECGYAGALGGGCAAVLKIKKAWRNENITDDRLFHHHGNGIFSIDGEARDLKDLMTRWPEHVANRD
jgi:flavin reductase (DIM6/NTAB) family NADH-FMN oxidoreductase RutF